MKFKNKFLILSLLFSFISCDLFLDKGKGALEEFLDKDTIEEDSKSSQHVDGETFKKRSRRSVLEETVEVVESVLKAVLKPVVVDDKEEEKIVAANKVGTEEEAAKESKKNKEVEEKDVKDLEVKLQLNKDDDVRDVKDALSWIKTIKTIKERKSDIMEGGTLAIAGDIELLKKIVSQKYKQEDKANDISKLLEDSRQAVLGIMRSSYEYNEESFSELESNFEKVKNFLEEAIEKNKKIK
ncbi:hypothetical protein BCD_1108 (plasmid) [Borrelia crocidurae DOU]|uniref:Uncharacterized protein n=1 Tax=Borrelia crocidurae DOU TaxID=1293575 RepID=W5SJ48_9SPIR|nr:hypothetical protein [Borrelia crocidurae]AHH07174.1 hypothetical protein BCD_1108 [Borrelia crocidurae DOU]